MCGIFFSLSTSGAVLPTEETCGLLRQRGPDSFRIHTVQREITQNDSQDDNESHSRTVPAHLAFISTVLSLRGDHVHNQPLVDDASQSVLCWNGEAWKVAGEPVQDNDTELIFQLFVQAVEPSAPEGREADSTDYRDGAVQRLVDLISSISGPFSFVFYDAFNSKLFFSRDCLGRRSLLQGTDEAGNLKICSLCDGTSSAPFEEVGTDGVYVIDLAGATSGTTYNIKTLPWAYGENLPANHLRNPIPPMNKATPKDDPPRLTVESNIVKELERKLGQSLELRIQDVPESPDQPHNWDAKIAVLFSGGLDCTLLARISHKILPTTETIDLLNVAFENPRVTAAAAATASKEKQPTSSAYESCPDRITGRAAFAELQKVCPGRNWRFVAIDVAYTETISHRDHVKRLMRPHNTEMDLSIACALYFASRGQGMAFDTSTSTSPPSSPYTTPARVLLSGLGADELFAGYGRHGVSFTRAGFSGLIDEINLDVSRLGKRNLGRDDRILCTWGREARYPFLDEEFVSWVLQLPVWEKCGFGMSDSGDTASLGGEKEKEIDPEKKALRLVALHLGMENVSREKKRAIQFGSRTAKMEKGRTRGTDALS